MSFLPEWLPSKSVSRVAGSCSNPSMNSSPTHGLSLTPEGDRLLAVGQRLLEEVDTAEAALANTGHRGATGRVKISVASALFRRCIMPDLPAFLRAHPEIALEIEEADDFSNLAQRGVDLALGTGSIAGLPGHFARRICTFPGAPAPLRDTCASMVPRQARRSLRTTHW